MDTPTKKYVLHGLSKLDYIEVILHFDGGNDEGGVSDIKAIKSSGETVLNPPELHLTYDGDHITKDHQGKWVAERYDYEARSHVTRPATPEEINETRLKKGLADPIYDRWGSFAGDFEVQGTLTWNVPAGTAKMAFEESSTTWSGDEVEW